jgi:predicted nucleic acid-binding protein
LARLGHQAGISDLLVAVAASHHGRPVFTLDADFERIKTVLPLDLYRPRG